MKNIEAAKYLKSYAANAVLVKLSELEGIEKNRICKRNTKTKSM